MKIRQGVAIILSGSIWMVVGVFLLTKGFSLLLHPLLGQKPLLLPYINSFGVRAEQASLVLVTLGLFIGFLKGRLILAKTAAKVIKRILGLPNPCSLFSIYARSYLILLSSMILLGISMKWFSIPYDIKGVVDVAIGSALTNGSAFYFRHFAEQKRKV